jgi:hypothetical protein
MGANGIKKRIKTNTVINKANMFWIRLSPVPLIMPIVKVMAINNRCCITKRRDSNGILSLIFEID